jgi:hypothetical protein
MTDCGVVPTAYANQVRRRPAAYARRAVREAERRSRRELTEELRKNDIEERRHRRQISIAAGPALLAAKVAITIALLGSKKLKIGSSVWRNGRTGLERASLAPWVA